MLVGVEPALDLAPLAGVHGLGLVGGVAGGAAGRGRGVVPVHRGHVVAVGAVLRLDLPVAVVGVGRGAAQHLEALGGLVHDRVDHRGGVAQVLLEGQHVRVEGAEQEAAVGVEAGDLGQVVRALLVEVLRVAAVAAVLDLEQLAGVLERPPVEGAGEGGAVVRLAPAEHRTAVGARVDDAVQLLLLVTGDDHRGAADVGGEVVAHVGDLRLVGQVHPVALEDVLHLQLEDLLVGEDLPLGPDEPVLAVVHHGVGEDLADVGQVLGHDVLLLVGLPGRAACSGCLGGTSARDVRAEVCDRLLPDGTEPVWCAVTPLTSGKPLGLTQGVFMPYWVQKRRLIDICRVLIAPLGWWRRRRVRCHSRRARAGGREPRRERRARGASLITVQRGMWSTP